MPPTASSEDFAQLPGADPESAKIVIGVCTYRRPQLEATLTSLAHLALSPHWSVSIIVADNDDIPSAHEIVTRIAKEHLLPIKYCHAPSRNISIARNACLSEAEAQKASYLAFIDDDETADPAWLSNLMLTIQASKAAIAFGPVQAVYRPEAPQWMKQGEFHGQLWASDEAPSSAYTSNVIYDLQSSAITGKRFSDAFGRTGGEDLEYSSRVTEDKGAIAYASEAWVHTLVPPERASLRWLIERRFRMGQVYCTICDRAEHPSFFEHIQIGCKALFNSAAYAIEALICAVRGNPVYARRWILDSAYELGTATTVLRLKARDNYGGD
jgi:succinoglycan biosynthesis protein ExoM